MMIDNPIAVVAGCTIGAAVLNLAMLKVSPQISARVRHILTGAVPSLAVLGGYIGLNDSVAATGTDLLILAGSAISGLVASVGSTRFVTPNRDVLR